MSQAPPPPVMSTGHLPANRGGTILALGICSIVFGGACGVGLILGIIGFKMAGTDEQDIALGNKSREGEGLIQAGKICSIIGICLGSIGALIGLFYLAIFILAIIGAAAGAAGGGTP